MLKLKLEWSEGQIRDIEKKDTFLGRTKGLMFRDEGRILLEFPFQGRYGVWMPFMKFSIDVAYISKEGKVVDLREEVPPMGLSPSTWKIYRPSKMCKYILEVESGVLGEKGLSKGTEVKFVD